MALVRKARRVVPPESRRQQTLHKAASRTLTLVDHGPSALAGLIRRDRELRRAIGVADTAAARRRQYRRWLALHTPRRGGARDHAPHCCRETTAAPVDQPRHAGAQPRASPGSKPRSHRCSGRRIQHLELCIADDASTQPHVRADARRGAADPRVRVVYRDQQGGIAAASNSALALATGEFVGFIDNDDVLRPHALYSMAAYLREHPDDRPRVFRRGQAARRRQPRRARRSSPTSHRTVSSPRTTSTISHWCAGRS